MINMLTSQPSIKLAIIGSKSVGKTALVVRFLTKRYIGEYNSTSDHVYKSPANSNKRNGGQHPNLGNTKNLRNFKLLDTCGDFVEKNEIEVNEILDWANGFVIIYDICNRFSFNTANKVINLIKRRRRSCTLPISLIGNKKDLEAGRRVSMEEGIELAGNSGATFVELSTADDYESVKKVMDSCLEEASKRVRSPFNSTSNLSTNMTTKQSLHEMAKLSSHIVSSPFTHLLEVVLSQRRDSFSHKVNKLSKLSADKKVPTKKNRRILFLSQQSL